MSAKCFIVEDTTKLKRNPIENDEVDKASKDRLRKKMAPGLSVKKQVSYRHFATHLKRLVDLRGKCYKTFWSMIYGFSY